MSTPDIPEHLKQLAGIELVDDSGPPWRLLAVLMLVANEMGEMPDLNSICQHGGGLIVVWNRRMDCDPWTPDPDSDSEEPSPCGNAVWLAFGRAWAYIDTAAALADDEPELVQWARDIIHEHAYHNSPEEDAEDATDDLVERLMKSSRRAA